MRCIWVISESCSDGSDCAGFLMFICWPSHEKTHIIPYLFQKGGTVVSGDQWCYHCYHPIFVYIVVSCCIKCFHLYTYSITITAMICTYVGTSWDLSQPSQPGSSDATWQHRYAPLRILQSLGGFSSCFIDWKSNWIYWLYWIIFFQDEQ